MKTASKTAVIAGVLVSLLGCGHRNNSAPPPQAQAPPLGPPSTMTHISPMPALPPPTARTAVLVAKAEAPPTPPPPPKRPRHKPSPVKTPAETAAEKEQASAAQASAGPPADVSPIGQLSSTGEASGTEDRQKVAQLISTVESGLANIKRPLSADEQVTAAQIKVFLAKSKLALTDNDLDGAHTLATKAKVLLEELTKS